MRYVNGALFLLMMLFAAVQYNDPDGALWAAIYAVPAVFAGLAAWQPRWLQAGIGRATLVAAIVAALATVVFYWPTSEDFWRIDVWWHTETAREGMGAMVGLLVLLVAFAGSAKANRQTPA